MKKYDTYCSICGFAIPFNKVGANIETDMVMDFDDMAYCSLAIHICKECWVKIQIVTRGGMKKAIAKSKELKQLDKKQEKVRRNESV